MPGTDYKEVSGILSGLSLDLTWTLWRSAVWGRGFGEKKSKEGGSGNCVPFEGCSLAACPLDNCKGGVAFQIPASDWLTVLSSGESLLFQYVLLLWHLSKILFFC